MPIHLSTTHIKSHAGFTPSIAHAANVIRGLAALPIGSNDADGQVQLLDLDPLTGKILQPWTLAPHFMFLNAVFCRTATGLLTAIIAAQRSKRAIRLGAHAQTSVERLTKEIAALRADETCASLSVTDGISQTQDAPPLAWLTKDMGEDALRSVLAPQQLNPHPYGVLDVLMLGDREEGCRWDRMAIWCDFELPHNGEHLSTVVKTVGTDKQEARELADTMGAARTLLCLPAPLLDVVKYRE